LGLLAAADAIHLGMALLEAIQLVHISKRQKTGIKTKTMILSNTIHSLSYQQNFFSTAIITTQEQDFNLRQFRRPCLDGSSAKIEFD
jgi:hypothetical protein